MVMKAWEPDFIPGVKVIQKAIVWLRLLVLPMKFWLTPTILAIMIEANKTLATDDLTDLLRKTGYAWI